VQLVRSFFGPFGELLAGLFVLLEVGHSNVAVQCAVATEKGLAQVDDTHEGRHGLCDIGLLVLGYRIVQEDCGSEVVNVASEGVTFGLYNWEKWAARRI
jgi:hypothetical protein